MQIVNQVNHFEHYCMVDINQLNSYFISSKRVNNCTVYNFEIMMQVKTNGIFVNDHSTPEFQCKYSGIFVL